MGKYHVNKYGFQNKHGEPINSLDTVEAKDLIG
jgi:hypothetical protein